MYEDAGYKALIAAILGTNSHVGDGPEAGHSAGAGGEGEEAASASGPADGEGEEGEGGLRHRRPADGEQQGIESSLQAAARSE